MIVRIYTAAQTGGDMLSYRSATAIAGKGLDGDRYALGLGHYSGVPEWDAHITLMQIEPIEALAAQHGIQLAPQSLRRNLITRGVDLDSLVGCEFRIGPEVVLRGRKPWPPCLHLVKHYGSTDIFKYLAKDCGIGADIIKGGHITLGDGVAIIPAP
jgi:MOSC domain-containing protein YiiM